MTQTGPHTHSPYRRGADDGFVFGAYLTASFLTMVWSSAVPLLGLVSMLLLAGVPVFIYMRLRRSFVADSGHTLLSSLWMQGIATFACGSLIAGAVATAYLKWIEPDFIIGRLREAIDFYSGSGWERGQEVADTLQRMIDMHLVPSAVAIVVELIWLAIFSGSLVSLLMALLARSRPVRTKL